MRRPISSPEDPGAAGRPGPHPLASEILACARGMLATPFHHQGRLPGRALDCVGLVLAVAQALSLTAYDHRNYPRLPRPDMLMAHAHRAGFRRKALRHAAAGDVLVMRFHEDPCHVAIATENLFGIIHACARRGRVIEHRLDPRWRRRIVACLSFPTPKAGGRTACSTG